jgi:hypothetical protein
MQWPFGKTDPKFRVFRDPKTQELTLSVQEDWDARVMQIAVDVRAKMGIAAAIELRDQLNQLLGAGEGNKDNQTMLGE